MIEGPVGQLDTLFIPSQPKEIKGVAVICHPNPLEGGNNTNKIVQTVAKTLSEQGYHCYCPNLRGVGESDGEHDYGKGEVEDVLSVIDYAKEVNNSHNVILAGFSFGAYVALFVSHHVELERLLLIGAAVGHYEVDAPNSPKAQKTFVLHGEDDDVIALQNVLDWARPQNLPVMVLPGTGHFFHGQLIKLKQILMQYFNTNF